MEPIHLDDSKHWQNIRHNIDNQEVPFPIFPTTEFRTTSSTKINIFNPRIPITNARIMNLTFFSLGTSLNLLIVLVIVLKSSMRTSWNLYLASLACANMVILLEPLEEILRWLLDVNLNLNMDYVWLINFDVSIVTIAILKFMLYIDIFQYSTPFGNVLVKRYTSVKAISLVWIACTLSIAIGLHIFDFFEGDMADIYVWNAIMFTAMPFIIFVVFDSMIICELIILKAIEGSWRLNELRRYCMLVIIGIVFFLIRAPYRIARAINFIEPKALCCTDSKREVLSFMAKTFPIIFSIIYISSSIEFRKILQEILTCQRRSSKEIHADMIV